MSCGFELRFCSVVAVKRLDCTGAYSWMLALKYDIGSTTCSCLEMGLYFVRCARTLYLDDRTLGQTRATGCSLFAAGHMLRDAVPAEYACADLKNDLTSCDLVSVLQRQDMGM